MEVVFGTSNQAKVDDIRTIIKNPEIKLRTLVDIGIEAPGVEENGQTFEDNALIKYNGLRLIVPAEIILVTEDSGIEIEALNGEPGVHARRWGPNDEELTDQEIVKKTLRLLKDKQNRAAKFVSVMAFGGASISRQVVRGELEGVILEKPDPKGTIPGFPYRALFYIPQAEKMLYEIHDVPLADRNGLPTHREIAWQKLEAIITKD